MTHPYIKDAEQRLARAQDREIKAKNEAEIAMRQWAFSSAELGEARASLHQLRQRFPEN